MEAFERFDFDASSAWIRFRDDSVLTTDADALLLAKAKWYKKSIAFDDDSFDVDLVRKKIIGKAAAGGAASGSASARSARSAPAPPPPPRPPPSSEPKPTTRTAAAARQSPSSWSPSSSSAFSPRALLSSLSSASPVDAAALASRFATLLTGFAFLTACASAWLLFLGVPGKLPLGRASAAATEVPNYYSPQRAPVPAAAWRRFALSASISHFSALFQAFGVPPIAATFRGGSINPQAMGPVLSWVRSASQASDANLLFFLMLSSSSPAAPAAVPSLVAALFALLESFGSGGNGTPGSGSPGIGRIPLFPGTLRSLLESKRHRAAQTAAAAELAQGSWLLLSTLLGRGGGFLTALGFWRTYAPMRLANSEEFRGAAAGLARGAARAARRASGRRSGGGGSGVAAFFERLEARLLRARSD